MANGAGIFPTPQFSRLWDLRVRVALIAQVQ
jgi:hypothetical protein